MLISITTLCKLSQMSQTWITVLDPKSENKTDTHIGKTRGYDLIDNTPNYQQKHSEILTRAQGCHLDQIKM